MQLAGIEFVKMMICICVVFMVGKTLLLVLSSFGSIFVHSSRVFVLLSLFYK